MIQKYIRLFLPIVHHCFNLESRDHDDFKLTVLLTKLGTANRAYHS